MELTFELTLDYGDLTDEEMEGKPTPAADDIVEGVRTHLAGLGPTIARPIRITADLA